MTKQQPVALKSYRNHRLEVLDDGGDGWVVTIYEPQGGNSTTLRNRVPSGLSFLMEEAEAIIDRRLDFRPWDGPT
ncbi:hypothetical protein EON80_20985 [bacterium]|nr:MAG: hypothetical protein EON80_20985 [bacterium]